MTLHDSVDKTHKPWNQDIVFSEDCAQADLLDESQEHQDRADGAEYNGHDGNVVVLAGVIDFLGH